MKWFRSMMGRGDADSRAIMEEIQSRFSDFLTVLEENNRVHHVMSDMEEKAQGETRFDLTYLRDRLQDLRSALTGMIDSMVALGGDVYEPLRDKFVEIDHHLELLMPHRRPLTKDEFTIPFSSLGKRPSPSVGSKCTQLGQIMVRLDLPVPDGFAITGWAYQQFMEANGLNKRINRYMAAVDVKTCSFDDLVKVSNQIRAEISRAEVPAPIVAAIERACVQLAERSGSDRFSVRSSAIGEDTHFSFAGQYATFLNVSAGDVVARYRDIIASKFSPQAMYYFLSFSQPESELVMSVGCVEMVDARSSGVIYTRDPVRPHDEAMVVNAIFGLGGYLVDGTLTPDSFRLSRQTGRIIKREIVSKPVRLALDPSGGTVRETLDDRQANEPSVSDEELAALLDYALKIEALYHCPQDIEWAIDREGRIYVLQSRSLRIIEPMPVNGLELKDLIPLMRGGATVCPGAGGGPVYHAKSVQDLAQVPDGAVLVAPHSFPGIVTIMRRVSAIVTEVGGVANHMATIAREYGVPTIGGVRRARELPAGREVTVDASKAMIYDGIQQQLISARRPEYDTFDDMVLVCTLRGLLDRISPLNLVHPNDENFAIEHCTTFHDLTRFCHQRAMEEMFYGGLNVPQKEKLSVCLKSEIPLKVNVICVDKDMAEFSQREGITEDEIECEPMRHFWAGILREGWPTPLKGPAGSKGPLATIFEPARGENYSESSFAILGKEYMIVSLRMGYHFTTVEAMCSEDQQKNYVRMQYHEGGATPERRERRIKLITDVLSRLGFEHYAKGDFLDTRLTYRPAAKICRNLYQLGRLTMLTKQLDMALSNDRVAEWYTRQFLRRLGIE